MCRRSFQSGEFRDVGKVDRSVCMVFIRRRLIGRISRISFSADRPENNNRKKKRESVAYTLLAEGLVKVLLGLVHRPGGNRLLLILLLRVAWKKRAFHGGVPSCV